MYLRICCATLAALMLFGSLASSQDEANFISNGGFEAGLEGWTHWPEDSPGKFEIDKTVKRTGLASLKITTPVWDKGLYVLRTCTGLKPETPYEVTYCYRLLPGTRESSLQMKVNYWCKGANGKLALVAQGPTYVASEGTEGDWKVRKAHFRPPAHVDHVDIIVGLRGTPGAVWFDDLAIRPLQKQRGAKVSLLEYFPIAVEILDGPLARLKKLREAKSPIYLAGVKYNDELMATASLRLSLSRLLREATYVRSKESENVAFMAARSAEKALLVLDNAYQAFGEAFCDLTNEEKLKRFENILQEAQNSRKAVEAEIQDTKKKLSVLGLRHEKCVEWEPMPLVKGAWILPNGKANRLLYGGSGGSLSDRCKYFDFLFKRSWQNVPLRSTPQTNDFSNFNTRMELVRQSGYEATNAAIFLAVHQNMLAPDWIMEMARKDPDILYHDAQGKPAKLLAKNERVQPLNIFHPTVHKMACDLARDLAREIRKWPLDKVLYYEYAMENYNCFTIGNQTRQIGYGRSATKAFQEYLQRKFGAIEKLNAAWGSAYASFLEIKQPPDKYIEERRRSSPLIYEFESFIDNAYIDHLKGIYEAFKREDPQRPVMIDPTELLRRMNGARIFECCDLLSVHTAYPLFQVQSLYINTLRRFSGKGTCYSEDHWGCQEEARHISDERAQFAALRKIIYRNTVQGKNPQIAWYEYTSGDYLTTYNGNWYDPRYDLTTLRYSAGGLATALAQCRRLERVFLQTEVPVSRLMVIHPEASFRVAFPYDAVLQELLAMHELLWPRNMIYELTPESYVMDGRCAIDSFRAIILPYAPYFPPGLADKLRAWVQTGGLLICLGPAGVQDPYGRPDGMLLGDLGALEPMPESGQPWQWKVRPGPKTQTLAEGVYSMSIGEGRIIVTDRPLSSLYSTPAAPAALIQALRDRGVRRVWGEQDKFELMLRQHRDETLYLFALNPSPFFAAQDDVVVEGEFSSAVDIDAQGAVVPIERRGRNTAIRMRLAPADFTCLRLRK